MDSKPVESIGASEENQLASVNAELSVQRTPISSSSTWLSRPARKRAQKRLAKLKASGDIKNDDVRSSESEISVDYLQSYGELREQINVLFGDVQARFAARDQDIADLSENFGTFARMTTESIASLDQD